MPRGARGLCSSIGKPPVADGLSRLKAGRGAPPPHGLLWLAGVRGGVSAEVVGQHLLSRSVQAQLKSVGKSLKSYLSELRAWRAFVHMRGVPGLPASERSVLEYLGLFRNGRSAAQYVAALRFLHDVCMMSREGTDAKSVKRALLGLTKATPPCKRAHAILPEPMRSCPRSGWRVPASP